MLPALLLAFALSGRADSTLLRVLAINDFHGALESRQYSWSGGRPVGGAAALKAALDSAAAECRCPVLRLDGGDELQGTLASNLVHGRSTIEVLRRFGLDAAVVGNHELDWGVDTLRARMGESSWPWLAANVFDSLSGVTRSAQTVSTRARQNRVPSSRRTRSAIAKAVPLLRAWTMVMPCTTVLTSEWV